MICIKAGLLSIVFLRLSRRKINKRQEIIVLPLAPGCRPKPDRPVTFTFMQHPKHAATTISRQEWFVLHLGIVQLSAFFFAIHHIVASKPGIRAIVQADFYLKYVTCFLGILTL